MSKGCKDSLHLILAYAGKLCLSSLANALVRQRGHVRYPHERLPQGFTKRRAPGVQAYSLRAIHVITEKNYLDYRSH
ncbi:hypothetical protein NIES4075_61790 [Tolypothrix sp. NIES-4075]|nr:hypothetical protein NIES4075_61790 [Tolypothrix sp. NIES-4075]